VVAGLTALLREGGLVAVLTNEQILDAMIGFAKERRERGELRLIGDAGYIRVSGGGFRAVSVSEDAPLSRFAAAPTRNLEKAVAQTKAAPHRVDPELSKDERCVQAHIIRNALERRGDLLSVFGPELPFEELRFAFDEVRLYSGEDGASGGLVRCDLLAVGKSYGRFEPVLIELKYARGETRLLEQFANFERIVAGEKCRTQFAATLAAATGVDRVTLGQFHRVIVWPSRHPQRAQKQAQIQRLAESGIHCIGYELAKRTRRLPAVRRLCLELPEVAAA
jgi:hypothetical protein